MDLDLVEKGGFQKRCDMIFEMVQQYCGQEGLTIHMSGLTKTILGCETVAEFPTAHLVQVVKIFLYVFVRCVIYLSWYKARELES